VGIFSFLTGNKDKDADEDAGRSRPLPSPDPPVEPSVPVETAFGATAPAFPDPPPHADTPFTPPEAWNIDALTAPPPEAEGHPEIGPIDPVQTAELQPKVVEAVKTVYDPEIPVDIYELGLIYGIDVDANRRVLVRMTLTSPACPSAQQIPSEVRYKVKDIPGVADAWVEIVWDPPWDKNRMSEAAKLQLGFF